MPPGNFDWKGDLRGSSSSPSPPPGQWERRTPTPTSTSSGRRTPSPTRQRSRSRSGTPAEVKLGDRVIVRSSVGDSKTGLLRYLGAVDFAEGVWAGVECFLPLGHNDGTVKGREYFKCDAPYGLFVPEHRIQSSPIKGKMGGEGDHYTNRDTAMGKTYKPQEKYKWNWV